MSRLLLVVFLASLFLVAQGPNVTPTVRGEIQTEGVLTMGDLVVQLQQLSGGILVQQAYVRADGSFEFRDVRSGTYLVKVLRLPGEMLIEQTVTISGVNDGTLELRILKETYEAHSAPQTISVRQLRNPPSKSALRAFTKAKSYSAAGDHAKAIDELRRILPDTSATGYAHASLGLEYLQLDRTDDAIAELQEAARLIPESPAVHTNLGYAWSAIGQFERAEQEARAAIRIDRTYAKARYLLGHVLLLQGAKFEEAVENLKLARAEVPKSRLILAQFYAQHGQQAAAEIEMREYSARAALH